MAKVYIYILCIYVYTCVCVYIYMYMYIHGPSSPKPCRTLEGALNGALLSTRTCWDHWVYRFQGLSFGVLARALRRGLGYSHLGLEASGLGFRGLRFRGLGVV